MRKNIKPGDIFQFQLPNKKYAYGRAFNSTAFGFCKELSDESGQIPMEINDYFFIVWFQSDDIEKGILPIIGNVPFETEEEAKVPVFGGPNPLFGFAVYENNEIRKATKEECEGLEPTTIFDLDSIINRIMDLIGDNNES